MKEHPILFSAPMVRAILNESKTQTRRKIKPQPKIDPSTGGWIIKYPNGAQEVYPIEEWLDMIRPKWKVGDRLWVKETHFLFGSWMPNGETKSGKQKWAFCPNPMTEVRYLNNPPLEFNVSRDKKFPNQAQWYKRNSLFMPRWESRITLEITGVRAEKLNEISEADAQAEGVQKGRYIGYGKIGEVSYKEGFMLLWDIINPNTLHEFFVWAITFKKL